MCLMWTCSWLTDELSSTPLLFEREGFYHLKKFWRATTWKISTRNALCTFLAGTPLHPNIPTHTHIEVQMMFSKTCLCPLKPSLLAPVQSIKGLVQHSSLKYLHPMCWWHEKKELVENDYSSKYTRVHTQSELFVNYIYYHHQKVRPSKTYFWIPCQEMRTLRTDM